MKVVLFMVMLVFIYDCSSRPRLDNSFYLSNSHWKLYSHPDWQDSAPSDLKIKRIVVLGTNDFHGSIDSIKESSKELEGTENIRFSVGGAAILSAYFKIIRAKYPNQTLFLDAGDATQGSLISNTFQGASVIKLYNYLNYDALVFGNHSFDFGPKTIKRYVAKPWDDPQGALKRNVRKSKAPYLVSNIIDIKTGRPVKWKNTSPYLIKTINGVKIGLIGGTTTETPESTIRANVRGLFFDDQTKTILKYAKRLRRKGAKIVLLLTHSGFDCGKRISRKLKMDIKKFNFEPDDTSLCNKSHELYQVLTKLPKNTIDGVVSGHAHAKIANFVNGIPVIQSYSRGGFFGRFELFYDSEAKKLLTDRTIIHQPTKLCHRFFADSSDCYGRDPKTDHSKQVPARFLGEEIKPDLLASQALDYYEKKIAKVRTQTITSLSAEIPAYRFKKLSPMGQLVADAVKEAGKAQIAMINSGGIKFGLQKGSINYGDLYRSLPFGDSVVIVKMNGKQLRTLVEIGTSGHDKGIIQISGLKATISMRIGAYSDLNNNGKNEDWEYNRLVNLTLADGTPIRDKKKYRVASTNFIANLGGDNYDHIFNQITAKNKSTNYVVNYRDAARKLLEVLSRKKVDISKHYLDPKNMAIEFID